ncbi:MAG: copper transporter [Nocardioidaceae bacterium]
MISFRYHIVSIVSVFLALAIGVALGGGPLKGEVDNTLVDQVRTDRATKAALTAQITNLRGSNTFTDQFATTVAPSLIGNTLKGRSVTFVVLPTARQSDVASLADLVGVAGGTVGGTVRVGDQLVDAGDKQLVDELGNQLEDRASGVSIPADASPYERIGTLIARAIGTDYNGGLPVDGPATSILAGLSTTSLLSAEGKLNRRGSLVLFVTGAGQGSSEEKKGAATIVDTLVQAVDAATDGVVLAGPTASAREGGQVKAVRDDVSAARDVSTVDALGRSAGQVVTIMALAGQATGRTGHYGAVDAADGAMPGAQGATD